MMILLCFFAHTLYAQKNIIKKDTIYYLVDTAATPLKDRMLLVGKEGEFYGYRLTCSCYPWNSDAFFIYGLRQNGITITKQKIDQLKLITLRKLIQIVAKFGVDRVSRNVFYFIERQNGKYITHQVFLPEPKQPLTKY